jgi:hypothetical protein
MQSTIRHSHAHAAIFCILLPTISPLAFSEPPSKELPHTYEYLPGELAKYEYGTKDPISRFLTLFSTPPVNALSKPTESKLPKKGWLGISMQDPKVQILDQLTAKPMRAIEISAIASGSGSDAAELQRGDVIVGIDGEQLQDGDDGVQGWFRKKIADRALGDVIKLKIQRRTGIYEVPVTLYAYPRAKSWLEQHPETTATANTTGSSLLQDLLAKEGLTYEFTKLLSAIRNETDKAVSPDLRNSDYNPFRLQEVNHVMNQPMDLPGAARRLSDRLALACNENEHNLGTLVRVAMDALDYTNIEPHQKDSVSPIDINAYLRRLVDAIAHANAERTAVLSVLDKSEVEFIYATAPQLLEDDGEEVFGVDPETAKHQYEDTLLRFFKLVMKLDLRRLMNASAEIADAIDPDALLKLNLGEFSASKLPNDWQVHDTHGVSIVETPAGRIVIGGTADNEYSDDAMLIIDFGGNDRYYNHAGGSTASIPFSVVIDLAGDDIYSSAVSFSQGAGFLGGGFLVDLSGDDEYIATRYAQGAGLLGIGVLADLQGSDRYSAIAESQGAGVFGAGLLTEGEGDDQFSGKFFVQGAGYIKGIGAIVEIAGNDRYIAGGLYPDRREPGKAYISDAQGFGYGMRPDNSFLGTSGGIGIISDAEGNDTYVADYFAQGASYWYALGILDDRKGNDRYVAGRYTQGAGIHASAGILMDVIGDDRYISDFGVSQGCGHDYGIGVLLDGGGNDRYIAGTLSQGAGNANGIGVLSDYGGDDQYVANDSGQGWGNPEPTTTTGSFGLLFDTGGRDSYSLEGKNGGVNYRSRWGIQFDSD